MGPEEPQGDLEDRPEGQEKDQGGRSGQQRQYRRGQITAALKINELSPPDLGESSFHQTAMGSEAKGEEVDSVKAEKERGGMPVGREGAGVPIFPPLPGGKPPEECCPRETPFNTLQATNAMCPFQQPDCKKQVETGVIHFNNTFYLTQFIQTIIIS